MPIYAQNPRTSTISTIIINGKYNECKPTLPPAAAALLFFLSHWTVFFCLAQPTPLLSPSVVGSACKDFGMPVISSNDAYVLLATGLRPLPSRDLLFERFNFESFSYPLCMRVSSREHLVFECPSRIAWSWLPWTTQFNLFPPRSNRILPTYHLLIWTGRIAKASTGFLVIRKLPAVVVLLCVLLLFSLCCMFLYIALVKWF